MAYITPDSAVALAKQIKLMGMDPAEPVFHTPIPFFSIYEKQYLLAHRRLVRDPKYFFSELYFPVQAADTEKFIFEPGRPLFHADKCCPEIEINSRKYLIPSAIRDKGKSAIRTYRSWFKAVRHYLDQGKAEIFLAHLKAKWDISARVRDIVQIKSANEETQLDDQYSIENRISRLLEKANWYLDQSDAHKVILDKYFKSTFLAYSGGKLRDNDTGYNDDTVKHILNAFDTTFKKPLKHLITEYHRLQFNPELVFDKNLLHRAGIRKCQHCHHPDYRRPVKESGAYDILFEDMLYLRTLNWKWEDVSGLN